MNWDDIVTAGDLFTYVKMYESSIFIRQGRKTVALKDASPQAYADALCRALDGQTLYRVLSDEEIAENEKRDTNGGEKR